MYIGTEASRLCTYRGYIYVCLYACTYVCIMWKLELVTYKLFADRPAGWLADIMPVARLHRQYIQYIGIYIYVCVGQCRAVYVICPYV